MNAKQRYVAQRYVLGFDDLESQLKGLSWFTRHITYPHYTWYPEHYNWLKAMLTEPTYLLLAARGCGKTSLLISFLIWYMLKYPKNRISLCSNTHDQAVRIVDKIKQQFLVNELLKTVFPKALNKTAGKAKENEVWLHGRYTIESEPNLWASGIEGQWTQRHNELVIAEDLVDEINSRTDVQRTKLKKIWRSTVLPTGVKNCRYLYIGTRYNILDYYNDLIEARIPTNKNSWDVYAHTPLGVCATSRFPEILPNEALNIRKKQLGSADFRCQYRMDPSALEGRLIKNEWINSFHTPPIGGVCILSIDLAASKKKAADYTALTVISKHQGKFYVTECIQGKWDSLHPIVDEIKKLCNTYPITNIVCEQAGTQAHAISYFQEHQCLPVHGVTKSKSKEYYMNMCLPYMEAGQFYLRHNLGAVKDQLLQFPFTKHDDAVDTISQGMLWLVEHTPIQHTPSTYIPDTEEDDPFNLELDNPLNY